ncbi:MAG: LysE family transporter [Anaerolineae bacterium]|nr:LysE family transporter [Anaerolineae bacterium]
MFSFISRGISLGFLAGASPGPFQSYLISTTLAQGWRKSLIVILTPLLTDGPIILLAVVVLKQIPSTFISLIQVVGGLYLLWIAYSGWKGFRAGTALQADASSERRTLTQGLMMNWLSPGPYIFWATINGPLLVQGLEQSVWHGVAFMVAFYGTFLLLLAAYVLVFDRVRHLDTRVTNTIFLLTLVVMVGFSLSLIGQGLGIINN